MKLSLVPWLVLLALIAAACGANESGSPRSLAFTNEPVVLTVWGWDGVFAPALVESFEASNPDIRVDIRTSGFDQHHTGVQNAIIDDGSLPDVVAIERTYLPDFLAYPEAFVDLATFGADELAPTFLPWRWEEGVADGGQIIGMPTDVGGLALAYRSDLFEEAGLPSNPEDVADRVRTWDDFFELGEEFQRSTATSHFVDSFDSLYRVRLGQEEHAYVDDAGQPDFEAGVATAWQFTVDAIDSDLTAGFAQFSPEWNAGFSDDSFAAIAAPSWMRGYIAGVAPETASLWSIVPVPGTGGNWGGSQLAVTDRGESSTEAWRFVEFMTSVETQLELFRINGNFPSTPELYETPEISELDDAFFGGQNVGRIYAASVEALPSQPTAPGQRDLDRIFAGGLAAVQLGEVESDVAWETSLDRAAELLATMSASPLRETDAR